jgi:hypothetical protein
MAKANATKQTRASAKKDSDGNGRVKEKLTNKMEAVRRALATFDNKARPAELQAYVKGGFGVEMTTQLISVYKSKLVKKKGKPGRKPKAVEATAEATPKPAADAGVIFRDLRVVKEISGRLGPARVRELVELMTD